jgi:hypothetical protein
MDVAISIMTNHIDIKPIVGIFVPKPHFGKVLLILRLGVAEPVCHSVVDRYGLTFAEVKEEMGFVHSEIMEPSLMSCVDTQQHDH